MMIHWWNTRREFKAKKISNSKARSISNPNSNFIYRLKRSINIMNIEPKKMTDLLEVFKNPQNTVQLRKSFIVQPDFLNQSIVNESENESSFTSSDLMSY